MRLGQYIVPLFDMETYAVEYFHMDNIQRLFTIPNWVPQPDVSRLELERDLRDATIHRDLAPPSYLITRRILEQYIGGTRRP